MSCCPETTFYKCVDHRLPDFPDAGAGTLTYDYYSDDDPNVPGFAPVVQEGPRLHAYTDDRCVSVEVVSQDGQDIRGSAGATNYFHSGFSSASGVQRREWSFAFSAHKCCAVKKLYIFGTDVDGRTEFYDASALDPRWVPAPENTVPGVGGVYTATAANQRFVLEWDVVAHGMPPVGQMVAGAEQEGQSVVVYLADYFVELRTKGCGASAIHYDEDGLYEGEAISGDAIGAECCSGAAEPRFPMAPPSCDVVTSPGVVERIWGESAVAHDNASNIFTGPPDPVTGLPTHISGPADVEAVVADAQDSANSTAGGGAANATSQAEWFTWVDVPVGGATFRDVNGNTGERIRYWTAAHCANPVEIGEVTVDTAGGNPDFDLLGAYPEGYRFFGKQLSDFSANSGIDLEWDLDDGNGFVNVPASALSSTAPVASNEKFPKPVMPAITYAKPPTVQRAVGPKVFARYDGGWFWGGWTPIHTEVTGIIDLGWEEAFSVTAPALDPGSPVELYDVEINAKLGRYQTQVREANVQSWLGWRVLVNGVVVATRATYDFRVRDERTNLGTETLARIESQGGDATHYVRNGVSPGDVVSFEFNHRYRVVNVQDGAWARLIAGAYSDATFDFTPRTTITDVS